MSIDPKNDQIEAVGISLVYTQPELKANNIPWIRNWKVASIGTILVQDCCVRIATDESLKK